MGWPPQAVRQCSLWQYLAAIQGWSRAHTGKQGDKPPSDDEFQDMIEEVQGWQ